MECSLSWEKKEKIVLFFFKSTVQLNKPPQDKLALWTDLKFSLTTEYTIPIKFNQALNIHMFQMNELKVKLPKLISLEEIKI